MAFNICVDFDGVLHSYTSGWKGYDVVADGPVPGAMEWLKGLIEDKGFSVYILSSRAANVPGISAIKKALTSWFLEQGYDERLLDKVCITSAKPPAWVTLDDRVIRFEGTFPEYDSLIAFKPWNKVKAPAVHD